jgi:PIN domain nuclease of toxin-antitoxin system
LTAAQSDVTILLDTHVWLWMVNDPDRLSIHARRHILKEGNRRLLSVASSWEIAIKYSQGKLPIPEHPSSFIPRLLSLTKTTPLPITHVHAAQVASLPFHHRDPFDRMLIAQALVEDAAIVTSDIGFARYGVKIIKAN